MANARPAWRIRGVAVIGDHPAKFANVTVAHGTIFWPDDELDWAPEPLYEAARAHALVAA